MNKKIKVEFLLNNSVMHKTSIPLHYIKTQPTATRGRKPANK